jgi:sulfur relay (sulfurtransferase) DsrF/TusC family protein
MNEEEELSFMSSFSENQNMFLFKWNISHNLQFQDTKSIISKNLSLYSSLYNSYQIKNINDFWNYISTGKRLLQPEAILSQ